MLLIVLLFGEWVEVSVKTQIKRKVAGHILIFVCDIISRLFMMLQNSAKHIANNFKFTLKFQNHFPILFQVPGSSACQCQSLSPSWRPACWTTWRPRARQAAGTVSAPSSPSCHGAEEPHWPFQRLGKEIPSSHSTQL